LSIANNNDLFQFPPIIVSLQCSTHSSNEYLTRKYVRGQAPTAKKLVLMEQKWSLLWTRGKDG
jgi:hypothetical protein